MQLPTELSHLAPPSAAVGLLSNGGRQRYMIEVESTTGYVAWKIPDGTTLVSTSIEVSLQECDWVGFWSCAGYQNTTPEGDITFLDCHGNGLRQVDVTALTALRSLDVSYNELSELNLTGLAGLQTLDAANNRLTELTVRQLPALRVLNCAHNRLTSLDLSGMACLQIVDCSHNQLSKLVRHGCTMLQDMESDGNPL